MKPPPRSNGVAFIQLGGKPDGEKTTTTTTTTTTTKKEKKTNIKGESHCYNCRESDHWSSECPQDKMSDEQRAELAGNKHRMLMNIQEEIDEEDRVSLFNMTLLQEKKEERAVR